METLRITCYPDPVLRTRAAEVKKMDAGLKDLAEKMLQTMRADRGIGLAGNQVGRLNRLVVVEAIPEILEKPLVLVNPVLRETEGRRKDEEGCLSFPGGISAKVTRHREVCVEYWDLAEKKIRIETQGLLAQVLQHEIDHLDGILFPDRLSCFARHALLRRYRQSGKRNFDPQRKIE